jgi:hypothetical protein
MTIGDHQCQLEKLLSKHFMLIVDVYGHQMYCGLSNNFFVQYKLFQPPVFIVHKVDGISTCQYALC